jgi:hypothetical protein
VGVVGRGGERDSGAGEGPGLGGRGCASSSSRLVSAQWRMGGAGVLFINHDYFPLLTVQNLRASSASASSSTRPVNQIELSWPVHVRPAASYKVCRPSHARWVRILPFP